MNKTQLVYENQLEFKKYAYKNGLKRKYDFYFDDVTCVDTKTSENIPEVETDNGLTFEKALKKIIKYFKNKDKLIAKEKEQAKKAKEKAKKLAKKEKEQAKKAKEKAKKLAKKEKEQAKKAKEKAKLDKTNNMTTNKKRGRKPKSIISNNMNIDNEDDTEINDNINVDVSALIQKEIKSVFKNIKNCKTRDEADQYIKSLGKTFSELYTVKLMETECGVDIIVTFNAITMAKTRSPWKQPKENEVKKVAILDTPETDTVQPKENESFNVFANINTNENNDTIEDIDNENEADYIDDKDENALNDDDIFNVEHEDERYDNEVDEDKVDFRRDYFGGYDDDGEINDDY